MRTINLTPHSVSIFHTPNLPPCVIPSSGSARVSATMTRIGMHYDDASTYHLPLVMGSYGQVTGLPDPELGTLYIVSLMVRQALPHRQDLASPAELVRDEAGNIIGCKALEVSA